MGDLAGLLVASVGINVIMFLPAFIYKTDKLTDISYALSFFILAMFAFAGSRQKWPHVLLLFLIIMWSVRLGGFLLRRIWKQGKDKRFDGMRENALKFLRFWLLQGLTVFVVLIPALQFMHVSQPRVTLLSYVGVFVFLLGLYTEATADLQKWHFNQNTRKKGKWIDSGLWGRSRHPNYLGEMMVWSGLYLYVVPSLSGLQWLIALSGPLYIITLLLFVSGIPLLEKSADKRWGKDSAYASYKKRVPVLIPSIRRK